MVMQSQGQTWWQSVHPMHRGRSMVQTWNTPSWRGPGIVLMQSTGQTVMQASQPVHMSSSRRARTLGSFFLAMMPARAKMPVLHDHRRAGRSTLDADVDFAALELDLAVFESKEGVVAADADVEAGHELGSALTDDDCAGGDGLAAVGLYTAVLRIAVASVASAALSFFMCH